MKNHLAVSLLGSFQATLYGEPVVEFRADSARALLAFLITDVESPYHRDVLAGLLWPDQPDQTARQNLRQALNRLRHAIRDREILPPFLTITRKTIQFNRVSDHWLDVTEFQDLITASQEHAHGRLLSCSACMERLQAAAELYRGELMAGFSMDSLLFEEWLVVQREKLHRQAMELFHTLAAYSEGVGNYERAQHYARRQIELEPWREEAHRQLMQALAMGGQRSAALAQYEACRHLLAEELGVEPAEETDTLYEDIRAGALAVEIGEPESLVLPPRRTMHNLPPQMTPFVGRQAELGQVKKYLLDPAYRLLTLVGVGGIGKTRLALAAAGQVVDRFAHGVWFVHLADVDAARMNGEQVQAHLLTAVAGALGLTLAGEGDPLSQLLSYLETRELLLILDNLEHVVGVGADLVVSALQAAPGVTGLVTSREPLYLQAEYMMRIEGLPVPFGAGIVEAAGYSSVVLFAERASRRLPGFALDGDSLPDVIRLCRLVEGVPLGIELAAGWMDKVSPAEIVRSTRENLDFLATRMRDAQPRHKSIRAVFEGSWNLLVPAERLVLVQASVFDGGFDQDAAGTVIQGVEGAPEKAPSALEGDAGALAAQDVAVHLRSLAGKSLLRRAAAGRYEMHGLLRRFAREKSQEPEVLAALGSWEAVKARYCTYYTTFLQRQKPRLVGEGQAQGLESISAEIDNVRATWTCAIEYGQAAAIERAIDSLFLFYYMRSWFQEGERAFEQLVKAWQGDAAGKRTRIWGKALACQGWFAFQLGRYDLAQDLMAQGVSVLRADDGGTGLAFALNYSGAVALHLGAYTAAGRRCAEALSICRALDDRLGAAISLNILGQAAFMVGEYEEAQDLYEQSLTLARQTGNLWGVAFSLGYLGRIAHARGAYEEARGVFQESVAVCREMGDRRGAGLGLNALGNTVLALDEQAKAERYFTDALSLFQEIGHPLGVVQSLSNLGRVMWVKGDNAAAREMFVEALRIARGSDVVPGALDAVLGMAEVLFRSGRIEQALALSSFIVTHAASTQRAKARAAELSEDLASQLPGETAAQAQSKGRTLPLESLVEEAWL